MATADIPDFLLGHAATAVALLLLFTTLFMILALAVFQMNPEKLKDALREARKSMWATSTMEQEPDVETGIQKQRRKRSRNLGRFSRYLRQQSPYELDDDVWLAPENTPAELAAHKVEAYDLPDDVWTTPFIAV